MMILNHKKVILLDDVTSRKNPDYSSIIYLTAAKVVQYGLLSDNRKEKEE